MTDKSKQNKAYQKESRVKRKMRKSRLEIALGSVTVGFSTSNEKTEGKFVNLQREKLDIEKKRTELEKAKLESE